MKEELERWDLWNHLPQISKGFIDMRIEKKFVKRRSNHIAVWTLDNS